MPRPPYPFIPKSNRWLEAGQFFDIPLDDGRFACGRVMVAEVQGRRSFVVGLMDWIGADVPTSDDLAGRGVLNQAITTIDAIGNNGGSVRGHRPLDEDALAAVDPHDGRVGATSLVWGWATVKNRAEAAFPGQ
jgi:hypothetical protein